MGEMAARIPDARHVTLPNVGHLSNLEDPAGFNRALAEFWRARGPRRPRDDAAVPLRRVRVESRPVTTLAHVSDLHFGRPAVSERLDALRDFLAGVEPDAIAVSGDLTQRCTNREFVKARAYLDALGRIAPCLVIPGNHDIRWLGAVARNLGPGGRLRETVHNFKYSRYRRYISEDLSPSLEVPGAVIAGLNTAHGISRGSLTKRFRDLGVIGHVKHADIQRVKAAFEAADPAAARIVMIHHNPIRGELSGRHGLANTSRPSTPSPTSARSSYSAATTTRTPSTR
jgi:pimeloyl-ACP methyl ester carboxylesterase